ncbi:MAG: site-2 protease family protein [Ignavibacteriales bacterium]|nr:site-2 protease family protein [Ignavibacteriales bacterium]
MDQEQPINTTEPEERGLRKLAQVSLHLGLLVLTFFTTTIAGVQWIGGDPFELANFHLGLPYSISILFILLCHESGHYFAARYHDVKTTLPYLIPFPPVLLLFQLFLNFGTFGAVIRTRSLVPSKRAIFDIGVAGPIAGFVASAAVLIYGFLHLPGPEYLLTIHPKYDFATNTILDSEGLSLGFGNPLMYGFLQSVFANPSHHFIPPMTEIYHYPYLCAGWFGLFVTAMNLIPIGQFDGGHLIYSMFGDAHRRIAHWSFYTLIAFAAPSITDGVLRAMLSFVRKHEVGQIIPFAEYSWSAWLVWAIIAFYLVKLSHPSVPDETPLDRRRMFIGWGCVAILVVSFTINPFAVSIP